MIIHRFLLIRSRSGCINILSDAYTFAAWIADPEDRDRCAGAGRGRRRHRLYGSGAAAPALAASVGHADSGDVIGGHGAELDGAAKAARARAGVDWRDH